MSGVRVGGTWRTPATVHVKVAGTWRTVATMSVKVAGVWRTSTMAGPPPVPNLSHTAKGQFTITSGYDPLLVYTVTNGTRVGNVITVPSVNAVMSVTAAYAAGAPQSAPRYGERKAYTAVQGAADVSYVHAPPEHGVNIPSTIGARWLYCREFPWPECGHQEGTMIKDTSPASSGYVDQYGEWSKVT